jgi:peptide-methionine (S)-S-oxide reductase
VKNPSYYQIGDHTESFQVDFDPAVTSFEKILDVYWNTHNHCALPSKRQYMSAIFYANEAQKKTAIEMGERTQAARKQRVTTYILPLGEFHLAEFYHQKYLLRQRADLFKELRDLYPKDKDFLNSTAAARMNGYLGGHGTYAQLEQEIDTFGLSDKARASLLNSVKRFGK